MANMEAMSCIENLGHGTQTASSYWASHPQKKALIVYESRASDGITALAAADMLVQTDDLSAAAVLEEVLSDLRARQLLS